MRTRSIIHGLAGAILLTGASMDLRALDEFRRDTSNDFELVPKVTLITYESRPRKTTDQKKENQGPIKPYSQIFDQPARFAWLTFDRDGFPLEEETLTIYEGMTVTVDDEGQFDLRMRVEAPRTQITMRMQLPICQYGRQIGSITIPPVRIVSVAADDLDSTSQSYLVTFSGRSETLRRAIESSVAEPAVAGAPCCTLHAASGITLGRSGTARFGGRPSN